VCGYFHPNPFTFRAVNRLDKDTSGIVLIAKDMLTASLLSNQIKSGEFIKTYLAIVVGKPNKNHFFIEKPIMKESENSIKRVCNDKGKYAKTECFYIKDINENLSLLKLVLHTGRTHQIRVHLSSINLPLYADSLYGERVDNESYYLHANSLTFNHPYNKEKITLKSKRDIDINI
jgi:23S rRNA pseudouridine1911/1915/1917 synthase